MTALSSLSLAMLSIIDINKETLQTTAKVESNLKRRESHDRLRNTLKIYAEFSSRKAETFAKEIFKVPGASKMKAENGKLAKT